MAAPTLTEQVAQLYNKIGDKERLPYRLSHARQPNAADQHNDEDVISYAQGHIDSFFARAKRAVQEFGKK